ncbi:MAG: PSD1 and planctomycete cytochrome C domain-containing protein [Rubripirellula sp.]|nr:PSD1 and planctomycete cytochrome C domain-containing protein [Rubripirellula sp.]
MNVTLFVPSVRMEVVHPKLWVILSRATLIALTIAFASPSAAEVPAQAIDFSRDILPTLSEHCFQCHGPDEATRETDLRLDQQASVLAASDSGMRAVVPGDLDHSELITRIISDNADLRMPPPESGKQLSSDQIDKLKRWVNEGAAWSKHWAFEKPVKPTPPQRVATWSVNNEIDLFVQNRLVANDLSPNERATKETLIRRATLDLTGLPPTIQEVDDFLADGSATAYERVLDRLLDSSMYAEHMSRIWLDAARYADTHGLHLDNERSIWPYRNWVIDAFARNMPFDQFTIEQLGGDLLPEPSLNQRIATGFNRCNVTTSEGGSIDDEYYARYAVDRVETTSTVWLGLTAGCAACHDHKFDPLTQKEFYQLFSYFYSLTERAMDGNAQLPPPVVKVPSDDQVQQQASYQAEVTALNKQIAKMLAEHQYEDPSPESQLGELTQGEAIWFDDKLPDNAKPQGDGADPWKFVTAPDSPVHSGENASKRTGTGLTQHFFTDANPKLTVGIPGRLFAYVYLDPENPPETVQLQFNDGSWNHRAYWGADKGHGAGQQGPANFRVGDLPETGKWVRLEVDAAAVGLTPQSQLHGWAFTQFGGTVYWDAAGTISMAPLPDEQLASLNLWLQYRKQVTSPPIPDPIKKIIELESEKRNEQQSKQLLEYYLQQINPDYSDRFADPLDQQAKVKKQLNDLNAAIPATLVMEDRPEPRQAYVLERGQYTEKRDPVSPQVPEWITPLQEGTPANRLGLAQWLVSPDNPLTARVTVNRFWQHHFGVGIVKTSEDFGIQGEQPTHPKLLDWLAMEFIENGWDIKRLHKLIMMSATYQQSSRVTDEKLAVDAENRLVARGPRFRLDAEVIRDLSLSVSGLLVNEIGGKSVRPYQPSGLWKAVGFGGSNTSVFAQDSGENLYRRSMYTFWKRTSPPPSMSTFDAPDRETCQVRRARTNTPLQSLVLMNDVQFVEAARKFAERVITEGGIETADRIEFAFRTVTSRKPTESERESLERMLAEARREFTANPEAATKLLATGEAPSHPKLEPLDVASWTMLTHLLLNLSETVTKG